MKQVLTNRITFCKKCNHAFIINIEGDDDTCDSCIAESELTHELIDEGVLLEVKNDD
jgi:hypothetical protein